MDEDDYESLPNSTVAINMFAGAVAGITEHSVMYPLDSVKVFLNFITGKRLECKCFLLIYLQ